jgi:hypothetical protein
LDVQGEFDFALQSANGPDALEMWRERRRRDLMEIARKIGLPLGQKVEVWLKCGIRLRGRLEFHEELLFMSTTTLSNAEFQVDETAFTYSEMESCVRL